MLKKNQEVWGKNLLSLQWTAYKRTILYNEISTLLCKHCIYENLKSENCQDYAQKPQRNCTFMNSASVRISFYPHGYREIVTLTPNCKITETLRKLHIKCLGDLFCFVSLFHFASRIG
jgi:hypothetical protein